uniref:Uncharacterized protein n=1 Tax=Arundo donax TaxID=35708 RepID=A0A0A9BR37_ARUDO
MDVMTKRGDSSPEHHQNLWLGGR